MHVWSSPIVVSSNNNKADVMCRYLQFAAQKCVSSQSLLAASFVKYQILHTHRQAEKVEGERVCVYTIFLPTRVYRVRL